MTSTVETRPIPGYEGRYSARSDGAIISHLKWGSPGDRVLVARKGSSGYLQVNIRCGRGSVKTERVHRLVCGAFSEPFNERADQVNHKNGVKTDNRAENLEWTTRSGNSMHAYRTGLSVPVCGEQHRGSRLNNSKVRDIIRHRSDGLSFRAISQIIGSTPGCVWNVVNYKTWRHVTRLGCPA